jgi:adenylate kinase
MNGLNAIGENDGEASLHGIIRGVNGIGETVVTTYARTNSHPHKNIIIYQHILLELFKYLGLLLRK